MKLNLFPSVSCLFARQRLKTVLKVDKMVNVPVNRPFPCSPGPLYQNEVRCLTFDMEMIFHSHANKTHFHKKG